MNKLVPTIRLVKMTQEQKDTLAEIISQYSSDYVGDYARDILMPLALAYEDADVPEIVEGPEMYSVRTGRSVAIVDIYRG